MNPKALIIYDGDCGVCSAFIRKAEALDRGRKFEMRPYQGYSAEDLARWGLDEAACAHEVKLIGPSGNVYGGAWAVNRFLWQYWPWKPLIALFYALPVFLGAEILGYKLFARNRSRISKWMGVQACEFRPKRPG